MRSSKHGFTLIECIIYCAASAVVLMAFMQFTTLMHLRFKQYNKTTHDLLSLYAGLQHTLQTLEKAPTLFNFWKRNTQTEIIYTSKNNDIGWQFSNNRLITIVGNYNKAEQQWISKTTYPIINNLDSCTFTCAPDTQGQISSITIKLSAISKEPMACTIALRRQQYAKKPHKNPKI